MSIDHDLNISFIDLGLPSGTLWSKVNEDAKVPEEVVLYVEVGKINLFFKKMRPTNLYFLP